MRGDSGLISVHEKSTRIFTLRVVCAGYNGRSTTIYHFPYPFPPSNDRMQWIHLSQTVTIATSSIQIWEHLFQGLN